MSNIVNLRGEVPASAGEPQPDLIEALEDLLERARSGEVQGVSMAYIYRDMAVSHGAYGQTNAVALLGALYRELQTLAEGRE